jgi:hypothetical protein
LSTKTPAAWLTYLEKKLVAQQREIQLFEDYYDGRHRLAFASLKFRQSFGYLFRALADNWCEIVVDAPVERLFVEGFRFGKDKPADTNAWDIWQANGLDSESVMAHTESVKDGRAFILVGPDEYNTGFPQITVEHASQVVVEHAPGNRRVRLAALKKWRDDDSGYEYATLYLPDRIWKWETKEPTKYAPADGISRNWVPRAGEESGRNRSAPFVPMIPLENNPTMLGGGRSDLKPAIPLQDAINKELADMLVASEFGAYIQRWVTGLQVDTDAEGPTSNMELKFAVSRLIVAEDEKAKFGQFQATDLNNYVGAIAMLLQHLAAQTRTPPHYLLGQIVNVSGDALKAAETGLVAKVKRKQIDFSDSWEEAIRLALKLQGGEEAAKPMNAETIWRDPEYRSEGEMVDAALKRRALGVPLEAIWEMIGASPQQVEDWALKLDLPERLSTIGASGSLAAAGRAGTEPALPAVSVTERSET